MEKTILTMSPQEFEMMVEHAIDRRMQVWLTQLLDALGEFKEIAQIPCCFRCKLGRRRDGCGLNKHLRVRVE